MRTLARLLVALWICLLAGCERRLTVYADPWLSRPAQALADEFQATHPDVRVELRFLSSEVVAWHIAYGQPVDVWLCFGPDIVDSVGIQERVGERMLLGRDRMVLATTRQRGKVAEFKTEGYCAVEASHRPGRRFWDGWAGPRKAHAGKPLVAGFQSQMREWMLRGWVEEGVVPGAFAWRHSGQLSVRDSSGTIPDAYTAFRLRHPRDPELASAFFEWLATEKSREILAAEGVVP